MISCWNLTCMSANGPSAPACRSNSEVTTTLRVLCHCWAYNAAFSLTKNRMYVHKISRSWEPMFGKWRIWSYKTFWNVGWTFYPDLLEYLDSWTHWWLMYLYSCCSTVYMVWRRELYVNCTNNTGLMGSSSTKSQATYMLFLWLATQLSGIIFAISISPKEVNLKNYANEIV